MLHNQSLTLLYLVLATVRVFEGLQVLLEAAPSVTAQLGAAAGSAAPLAATGKASASKDADPSAPVSGAETFVLRLVHLCQLKPVVSASLQHARHTGWLPLLQ